MTNSPRASIHRRSFMLTRRGLLFGVWLSPPTLKDCQYSPIILSHLSLARLLLGTENCAGYESFMHVPTLTTAVSWNAFGCNLLIHLLQQVSCIMLYFIPETFKAQPDARLFCSQHRPPLAHRKTTLLPASWLKMEVVKDHSQIWLQIAFYLFSDHK